MTETEGEMSAQKMCGHHGLKKVDYYDGWHILCTCGASFWDGHEYSDSHTAFNAHLQKMNAAAIAEAEERGRVEEREACAEIARLEVADLTGPLYNLENLDWGRKRAAEQIIEDIRARSAALPAKERE